MPKEEAGSMASEAQLVGDLRHLSLILHDEASGSSTAAAVNHDVGIINDKNSSWQDVLGACQSLTGDSYSIEGSGNRPAEQANSIDVIANALEYRGHSPFWPGLDSGEGGSFSGGVSMTIWEGVLRATAST
jgi:cell wall assembly regulator SMI1